MKTLRIGSWLVVRGLEPLVVLTVFLVLQRMHLATPVPVWFLAGLSVAGSVFHQPAVQTWLSGGNPAGRLPLRAGLELAGILAMLDAIGWSVVMPVVCLVVLARYQRMAGSVAWRPVAVCSALVIAISQALIGIGGVTVLFSRAQAQASAAVLTVVCAAAGHELTRRVRAQEQAETNLRRSEERFRTLVQSSTDVVMTIDADGRLSYLSPAIERIMGYPPATLLGTPYHDLFHPEDLPLADATRARALACDEGEHRAEMRVRHADGGGWRWHEVVVRNLLNHPAVAAVVANHRDISERRAFQDQLAYEARHDGLTGLINRGSFMDRLNRSLLDGRNSGALTAVMFVDLNGFKQTNDTWGHEAGDGLLVSVSRVLEDSVLGADVVARLGGDEFGIVLADVEDPAAAEAVAQRIGNALRRPLDIRGHRIQAPPASASLCPTGTAPTPMNCRAAPTKPCTTPSG